MMDKRRYHYSTSASEGYACSLLQEGYNAHTLTHSVVLTTGQINRVADDSTPAGKPPQ
jgi:hypothetical protein